MGGKYKRPNLLADDQEWDRPLGQARCHATPKIIRKLFAIVFVHCQPQKPRHVWNRYLHAITEDNMHDLQIPIEIAAQMAL